MTYVTLTLGAAAFLILGVSYFLVSWIPTVLTLEGLSVPAASGIAVLLNVGGLIGALGLVQSGASDAGPTDTEHPSVSVRC